MPEILEEIELEPTPATVEHIATKMTRSLASVQAQVNEEARGKVVIFTPDWARLTDTSNLLTSNRDADFYRVRIGFQFELTEAGVKAGAQFVYGVCTAQVWSTSVEQPRVYELYPREYYDKTKPPAATFDLGPETAVDKVGSVSLGKVSGEFRLGYLEPVVVAYLDKTEREPRWELRPQSKTLIGIRYVWLLLQVPRACGGARLRVSAEGDVQTLALGRIPVGPKNRAWDARKSVVIR